MTVYESNYGHCFSCGCRFQFNPDLVPTTVKDGLKHPLCLTCVEKVNQVRMMTGVGKIQVPPGAYQPKPRRLPT
jgi:hypothetical protein